MVCICVSGQEFVLTFETPDLRGSVMATDLNERWLEKQFADMLRQRFGRVHPCNS